MLLNYNGDISFYEDTGTTAKFFWDASNENLAIGASSAASDAKLVLAGDQGSTQSLMFVGFGTDKDAAISHNNGAISFLNGGNNTTVANLTERARIDSSGNLLVGKTSASLGTAGAELKPAGIVRATRDGYVAEFNRITTGGEIVNLKAAGTTVGSIGTASSNAYFGTADTAIYTNATSDAVQPFNTSTSTVRDGLINLGSSGARFKDLYLSGGVYLGGAGAANLLDDYEAGNWTPTLVGSTSGSITGFTIVKAKYKKVGDLVHVAMYISGVDVTASTISGNFYISGLPFSSENYTGLASVGYCNLFSFNEDDISISGYVAGSNIILLKGSSVTAVTDADEGTATSGFMMMELSYHTPT
jgi:hypothetical protein